MLENVNRIFPNEIQKEKNKIKQNILKLWDNFKRCYRHVIEMPKEERD